MKKTLLTPRQQETARRHTAIRSEFEKLKGQHPDASTWRICVVLSEKHHLTPAQIRNIIG